MNSLHSRKYCNNCLVNKPCKNCFGTCICGKYFGDKTNWRDALRKHLNQTKKKEKKSIPITTLITNTQINSSVILNNTNIDIPTSDKQDSVNITFHTNEQNISDVIFFLIFLIISLRAPTKLIVINVTLLQNNIH